MAIITTTPSANRSAATLTWIAFWLLFIGGLNWGLVGLFEFDLVAFIFGNLSAAARVIYTLVGVAAVYCAVTLPTLRRKANDTL